MTIFVGGLNWEIDDSELKSYFEEFGSVKTCRVMRERDTSRSRGFGFVEFESNEDGKQAMASMDGVEIRGRRITVSLAQNTGLKRDGTRQGPVETKRSLRQSFPEPEIIRKRSPVYASQPESGVTERGKNKTIEQMFIERDHERDSEGD